MDALSDLVGRCDLTLIDAPCTGTGTWRRHPDAKWRLAAGALTQRLQAQSQLFDQAARYVKPGGRLAYITCSVLIEENEAQVIAFIDRHPDFPQFQPSKWRKRPVLTPWCVLLPSTAQDCGSRQEPAGRMDFRRAVAKRHCDPLRQGMSNAAEIFHHDIADRHDKVLIVDFGSQVTQLIARRVREAGVYCEITPFQNAEQAFALIRPKAVILSGGPCSVADLNSPRAPQQIFQAGVPVLGICYGEQTMASQLGGKVEAGHHREFGRADLTILESSALFEGVWRKGENYPVWMSHGDRVTQLPAGFRVIAASENAPMAAIADEARGFYGVQFHLEVVHTPDGAKLLSNFVHKVAGLKADWTMSAFRQEAIAAIRRQVGDKRVLCGLSGGVDSAVAAVLIHEAIGEQLVCVFVDHGLLRQGEAEEVVRLFKDHYNIPLHHVEAAHVFNRVRRRG